MAAMTGITKSPPQVISIRSSSASSSFPMSPIAGCAPSSGLKRPIPRLEKLQKEYFPIFPPPACPIASRSLSASATGTVTTIFFTHLKRDHRGDGVAVAELHDAYALGRPGERGDAADRGSDDLAFFRNHDDLVVFELACEHFRADNLARLRGHLGRLDARAAAALHFVFGNRRALAV